MQSLQDDLSESQNPPHVQSEHSTVDSDTVQHTSGPVCLYCKKHLLEPMATICAGCRHLHRAGIKLTPKESITASEHNVQETSPPSSRMDTQDKYSTVFGAQSSAQVPAGTEVQTTSQCSSRNQEISSETGDDNIILKRKRNSSSDGTNEQLIKHIRTDDMSDPTEIDPVLYPGAAVSDGKNESSKSPETEASQGSDVGCFVYNGCIYRRDMCKFSYQRPI